MTLFKALNKTRSTRNLLSIHMKFWSIVFILAVVFFPPVRVITGSTMSFAGNLIAFTGNTLAGE